MSGSISITPVFGLQGSGRWSTDERPKDWRQALLKRYPKGKTPITALMSKAGKARVVDPEFHWWEEDTAMMGGSITDIYTDEAMSSALAAHDSAAGTTLYLKVDGTAEEPLTNYLVPGSELFLTGNTNYRIAVRARVVSIDRNGASSRVKVVTRNADSSQSAYSLTTANYAMVMPTLFSEFGGIPEVITYKPSSFYNYTSIKKEALALSRTAMKIKNIRPNENDTGYRAMKQKALYNLGIKMEHELLLGTRFEETDPSNNQLKRGSMGIREMIDTYGVSGARDSFKYNSNYTGQSWKDGGWDYLKQFFLTMQKWCDLDTTWNFVGAGTMLGLTDLADHNRFISITQQTVEYGLSIKKLITPFGELNLVDHPLFNRMRPLQYAWVGIPRGGLEYANMDGGDIQFLEDQNYGKGGLTHVDGRFDLWMVDCGYLYHDTKAFFWLDDIGLDNPA